MRRQKIYAVLIIITLTAGAVLFFAFYNRSVFNGNRVADRNSYMLDIRRMNGTDTHSLELRDGDTLGIRFNGKKSSLHMEIRSPDGKVLYAGNGTEATDFTISVPKHGSYLIFVKARHATGGSISIKVRRGMK